MGAQKLAPELCTSTSYDWWPKLHSLDVVRRESDDSGYESCQSSRIANSNPPAQQNSVFGVASRINQHGETRRSGITKIRDSSPQPSPDSDLARSNTQSEVSTANSSRPLDDAVCIALLHDDIINDCPDLETSSTCSDLSCTVDELLETDWPDLGIECAIEEAFLARKKMVAHKLNTPLLQHYREAWWTCEVAQPLRQPCSERFAAFRRSLHI